MSRSFSPPPNCLIPLKQVELLNSTWHGKKWMDTAERRRVKFASSKHGTEGEAWSDSSKDGVWGFEFFQEIQDYSASVSLR
jgi:hypothetical protein